MAAVSLSALRNAHILHGKRAVARKPLCVACASNLQQQSSHANFPNEQQSSEQFKVSAPLANLNPTRSETELVLDRAQRDLTDLCRDEDGLECWKALSYYQGKRHQYEEHCNLDQDTGEHDPEACQGLNRLEKFVREQMASGSAKNLRQNLLIMKRVEERRAAGGEAQPSAPVMSDKEIHERACLIRLFHALDTNGDGEIGMLEFQDGLEALGAVLTEADMRQISEAVGNTHNRLDIDEFIEVMQASPLLHGVALGDDSNFLRHAAHVHGTHHLGGHASAASPNKQNL